MQKTPVFGDGLLDFRNTLLDGGLKNTKEFYFFLLHLMGKKQGPWKPPHYTADRTSDTNPFGKRSTPVLKLQTAPPRPLLIFQAPRREFNFFSWLASWFVSRKYQADLCGGDSTELLLRRCLEAVNNPQCFFLSGFEGWSVGKLRNSHGLKNNTFFGDWLFSLFL